jgi:hypothetical protein
VLDLISLLALAVCVAFVVFAIGYQRGLEEGLRRAAESLRRELWGK